MKKESITRLVAGIVLALVLTGCGNSEAPALIEGGEARSVPEWMREGRPEDALSVTRARQTAAKGEKILVGGQIAGVVEPFFDGFSGFVLADPDLVFCDEMGEDHVCPTPWDACCEDPEKLKASRLTVQFVDDQGRPRSGGLKGVGGLAASDTVVIEGTVSAQSTEENLIIEATTLYR